MRVMSVSWIFKRRYFLRNTLSEIYDALYHDIYSNMEFQKASEGQQWVLVKPHPLYLVKVCKHEA